jgi:hypothetical protein
MEKILTPKNSVDNKTTFLVLDYVGLFGKIHDGLTGFGRSLGFKVS